MRVRLGFVRFTLTIGGLMIGLAFSPSPAAAQGDPAREIAASQKRLEEIRREREQLRSELARLRSRASDVSGDLRGIEEQVTATADLLQELEAELVETETEIEQLTGELAETSGRLDLRQQTLNRRLREIYKRGPLHTAQVLLTAESFGDLLNRYKYLFTIARSDRALVDEVENLERELALRQRKLRQSLFELEVTHGERLQEYTTVETLQQERKRTLASVRQQERQASERAQQLEEDEKQLRSLLANLERRRKEAERLAAERASRGGRSAAAAERGGLTTTDLGALGWPVEGTVIYRFGRSVQPNGTAVRQNGIGIAAPRGTPVKAIGAGTVMMASPFQGYGPTVVLSHGEGYYSLYLYLKDVAVTEGAEVERGAVLGTVGGDQARGGSHIEFQIRAPGGQAVDPLTWLQKRGG